MFSTKYYIFIGLIVNLLHTKKRDGNYVSIFGLLFWKNKVIYYNRVDEFTEFFVGLVKILDWKGDDFSGK